MEHIVHLAIPFALAAVVLVLLLGLWNMLRGGDPNLSQTLMRWRVILQFVAWLPSTWPESSLSTL